MTYMSEFIGSAFSDSFFNGQHTAQHSIAILPVTSDEIDDFDQYCDTREIAPEDSGLQNEVPECLETDYTICHHDVSYVQTVADAISSSSMDLILEQGEELVAVCERIATHQFRDLESTGVVFERVFLFEDGSILVVNGSDFDYGRYESSPLFDGSVLGGAA